MGNETSRYLRMRWVNVTNHIKHMAMHKPTPSQYVNHTQNTTPLVATRLTVQLQGKAKLIRYQLFFSKRTKAGRCTYYGVHIDDTGLLYTNHAKHYAEPQFLATTCHHFHRPSCSCHAISSTWRLAAPKTQYRQLGTAIPSKHNHRLLLQHLPCTIFQCPTFFSVVRCSRLMGRRCLRYLRCQKCRSHRKSPKPFPPTIPIR